MNCCENVVGIMYWNRVETKCPWFSF